MLCNLKPTAQLKTGGHFRRRGPMPQVLPRPQVQRPLQPAHRQQRRQLLVVPGAHEEAGPHEVQGERDQRHVAGRPRHEHRRRADAELRAAARHHRQRERPVLRAHAVQALRHDCDRVEHGAAVWRQPEPREALVC